MNHLKGMQFDSQTLDDYGEEFGGMTKKELKQIRKDQAKRKVKPKVKKRSRSSFRR